MEDNKFDEEEQKGWVKEEEKRNKVGLKININKRKLNLRNGKERCQQSDSTKGKENKNARQDNEIIQKQSEMKSRKQNEKEQRQIGDREREAVEHG